MTQSTSTVIEIGISGTYRRVVDPDVIIPQLASVPDWAELVNTMEFSHGQTPGGGFFLMLQEDFDYFSLDDRRDIAVRWTYADEAGTETEIIFYRLQVAKAFSAVVHSDKPIMLVELRDRRWYSKETVQKDFNVRLGYEFDPRTLNSGTAYTSAGIVTAILAGGTVGYDSGTPTNTPENYLLRGWRTFEALEYVLNRGGYFLSCDPFDNTTAAANAYLIGSTQTGLQTAIDAAVDNFDLLSVVELEKCVLNRMLHEVHVHTDWQYTPNVTVQQIDNPVDDPDFGGWHSVTAWTSMFARKPQSRDLATYIGETSVDPDNQTAIDAEATAMSDVLFAINEVNRQGRIYTFRGLHTNIVLGCEVGTIRWAAQSGLTTMTVVRAVPEITFGPPLRRPARQVDTLVTKSASPALPFAVTNSFVKIPFVWPAPSSAKAATTKRPTDIPWHYSQTSSFTGTITLAKGRYQIRGSILCERTAGDATTISAGTVIPAIQLHAQLAFNAGSLITSWGKFCGYFPQHTFFSEVPGWGIEYLVTIPVLDVVEAYEQDTFTLELQIKGENMAGGAYAADIGVDVINAFLEICKLE